MGDWTVLPQVFSDAERVELYLGLIWLCVVTGALGVLVLASLVCPDPSLHQAQRKRKWDPATYCPVGRTQQAECPHCQEPADSDNEEEQG